MRNILNLSEAGNLAIHALGYLVSVGPNIPVTAAQIASDIGVSESHLAKVLQKLAREGVIGSTRGAKGGFFGGAKLADLPLLAVVAAVDGPIKAEGCLLGTPVCSAGACRLNGLMQRIVNILNTELNEVTLRDMTVAPARISCRVSENTEISETSE